MADFVKDSINNAQNGPQVISKAEAEQFKKEYGPELYNDLIKKNTIAVEENTKAIKDMQSQNRKEAIDDQKQKKSLKDFFNDINNKLIGKIEKLNLSYESLKGPINLEKSIGSVSNNIRSFGNYIKEFGGKFAAIGTSINQAALIVQKGIELSMALNQNQTENNKLFLQARGISALSSGLYHNASTQNFIDLLANTAGSEFNIEKQIKPTVGYMSQYYNLAALNDKQLQQRLRSTLELSTSNQNLADIYSVMSGQSGGSESFIKGSLSAFTNAFEKNNLGLDKSLQQTKSLYDSNRRFNMSMNEAAGYIQKFNKQLQDGTLTLQDVTVMRNAVKGYSTGQNAGIGQALLNAGLGTPALLAAAGDPFKIAAVMREGKKPELDAMQKYLWDIAASQGSTDRQSMGERLRNLYSSFAGINLSDEQIRLVSQGRNYSLQAGALAPASAKQQEEFDKQLQNILDNNLDKTTTIFERVSNSLDKSTTKFLNAVNKFQGKVEKMAGNITGDVQNLLQLGITTGIFENKLAKSNNE